MRISDWSSDVCSSDLDQFAAVQKCRGIVDREQGQAPFHAAFLLTQERIAPDERTRLVQSDGEGQAGLDRRVLRGKLVTPGPEAFFRAKGLAGVIDRKSVE